jgi:lipid-A-disaccharide synthase
VTALAERVPGAFCVAGPHARGRMRAWQSSDALAVMGLAEIVRHLPRLAVRRTASAPRRRPDVYIGIDAPEFNSGVGSSQGAGPARRQYVSPQVWWRQARADDR